MKTPHFSQPSVNPDSPDASPAAASSPTRGIPGFRTTRWRIWCVLTAAAILPLAAAVTPRSDSKWLKNLSQMADPDALSQHQSVKVATSNNQVHIAWETRKKAAYSEVGILYTRSIDGGLNFAKPRMIATSIPGQFSLEFKPEFSNLVAEGPFVHIIYTVGWPSQLHYLRSTDYGATFEAPRILQTGYSTYDAHLAADKGKVVIAWSLVQAANNGNGRQLHCAYSNDHGATLTDRMLVSGKGGPAYYARDAAVSGEHIYIVTNMVDENWMGSEERIQLWASADGGASFRPPVQVTTPTNDDKDRAQRLQNGHYTPNLFATGPVVNLVWVNLDRIQTGLPELRYQSLRTCRSTDGGHTLGKPVILHTFPAYNASLSGVVNHANPGMETITGSGSNLYITTVKGDAPGGTFVWRSTDDGATWRPGLRISTTGAYPMTQVDPSQSNRIHTLSDLYFLSKDSGASFNGGVNPRSAFGSWNHRQMAVSSDGVVHYAATSQRIISMGNESGYEVFYRRIAPPPAPGAENKLLTCVADSNLRRVDHMQVPSSRDLNFTRAMTLEFWVRKDTDDSNNGYMQPIVGKKRLTGVRSYGIGAGTSSVNGSQIYAAIVTDATPSGGVVLPGRVQMAKGVWYHVAMTYDADLPADNLKLFVNGEPSGSSSVKGLILCDPTDSPLLVGNYSPGGFFRGGFSVDELRLWKRPRTQSEIAAAMGRTLAGTETGLVAYYNFNNTTKDITGRGNDGMLSYQESYVVSYIPPVVTKAPEIEVTLAPSTKLVDGKANLRFGTVRIGRTGAARTLVIKNTGTAPLRNLSIAVGAGVPMNFTASKLLKTRLAPGESTRITVRFKPGGEGILWESLLIRSNDKNENPFDIMLIGQGVR